MVQNESPLLGTRHSATCHGSRAALRPQAEEMLRELAFVYRVTRAVRQAMTRPPSASSLLSR
jgi:hypothetical protein